MATHNIVPGFQYIRPETGNHSINYISRLTTNTIQDWDCVKDNIPAKLHKVVLHDMRCNES